MYHEKVQLVFTAYCSSDLSACRGFKKLPRERRANRLPVCTIRFLPGRTKKHLQEIRRDIEQGVKWGYIQPNLPKWKYFPGTGKWLCPDCMKERKRRRGAGLAFE